MTALVLLGFFVLLPAGFALLCDWALWQRLCATPPFAVGVPVIYRREEASTRPAADACDIQPAEHGDFYYYSIINYLRVAEVLDDGRIIAVARNQQRLCFWPNDSSFRRARLRERLLFRPRFPQF